MMNKKNILITGSSQGIGLEIAKHFANNHNVYITGRYEEKLKNLCEKYFFKGYKAIDLTKDNAPKMLFDNLNIDVDILINNAGVYFYSPIREMNKEDIINSIRLNSLAPYELIKYYIPYMKQQKWGRIINIGSISGVMGEANASIYSMTKASLVGLTKSLALEVAQDNITVNIINPGWVDTELINNESLEQDFTKDEIIETIPQRRFVTPSEIASTCEFLISDNAKTITGQSINICAGLSLGY
ncbi:SDR family oxidoreductase [bacterium]|nr:SDR family oxidoreductase [bacterium]